MHQRKANSQKYLNEGKMHLAKERTVHPFILKHAKRSTIIDWDNNQYVDYDLCHGALAFGHAFSNAVLAAKKSAEQCLDSSFLSREEISLASFLCRKIPSFESVLFLPTETLAIKKSIDLSCQYTGKNRILKFDGFHCFLNADATYKNELISCPLENISALDDIFQLHKDKMACVLIDPIMTEEKLFPVSQNFLQKIREVTQKNNIVMIMDELTSGFRVFHGCWQDELNVHPDLTCLGKIVHGGSLFGVLGGKKEIVDKNLFCDHVPRASLAAGYASIKALTESFYKKLNHKAEWLARELNHFFKMQGMETAIVSHWGSMMKLTCESSKYKKLSKYLLTKNIKLSHNSAGIFYLSIVHSQKELEELLHYIKEFFKN